MPVTSVVIDKIQEDIEKRGLATKGGKCFFSHPWDHDTAIEYTSAMGGCSNLYYSLMFQFSKWKFLWKKKFDEWMYVSPQHAQFYQLTVEQKQKLESAIKSGLASAAQAVADYELVKHDLRKYKEILDYFKEGQKDEHVLRSLFIDRVDIHTDKMSMLQMTQRWPTIINDFLKLTSEDKDKSIDEIAKKLEISKAEAQVLRVKNKLFLEWKKLFFDAVKERYVQIKTMVEARKKSVEEYKNWLRPYITQYKMMRETTEKEPQELLTNVLLTPAFGQAAAMTGVRIWACKEISPWEKYKMESYPGGFIVDPYDDLVKEYIPWIEKEYNVKLTDEIVNEVKSNMSDIEKKNTFFVIFDIKVYRTIIKTPPPEGGELEDIEFDIYDWLVTSNILLLFLLELKAKEMAFEKYLDEMVGGKSLEEEFEKEVKEMFKEPKEVKGIKASIEKFKEFINKITSNEKLGKIKKSFKAGLERFASNFIKLGPYERDPYERITKYYSKQAASHQGLITGFLKAKMGVG